MKVQLKGELEVTLNTAKNGKKYIALVCNLGYTKKYISFNVSDIAELLGCSVADLYATLEKQK